MRYYMIRHKATGEFMPELRRGRGYSFWNPGKKDTLEVFQKKKLTGAPRLFGTRRIAHRAVVQWNALPNCRMAMTMSYEGEEDYSVDIRSDGRSKEDLEVVEVNIEVNE
jgi:hypothetical protein